MSNRTIFMRWFATVLTLILTTACMADLLDARKGKVAITVKWPQKAAYGIMAIPEGTTRIEVSIMGQGLDNALEVELTPGAEQTSKDVLDVPVGPKALRAIAYNTAGDQTATGQVAIVVEPNKINDALVKLEAVPANGGETPASPGPDVSPTPTPSLEPGYTVETLAGDGKGGAMDGTAPLGVRFKYPQALAYDAKNQAIYIADPEYKLIRRLDLTNKSVTTVAGQAPTTGQSEALEPSPEASTAPPLFGPTIGEPAGMAIGPEGALYFADRENHVIRKLLDDGSVVTVAGNGKPGAGKDGVQARATSFYYPVGVAFDPNGTMYVADQLNQQVRRVSTSGLVTTVAGNGTAGNRGDGGPAVEAELNFPTAIAIDPKGEYLYIAEGRGKRVRRMHLATGIITPVAGSGLEGVTGEGGPAIKAQMGLPLALAFNPAGELLIAEGWNARLGADYGVGITSRILKVTDDGRLVRIAGQQLANAGFNGDGGDALKALFSNPAGLAVDADGRIIVSDSFNNRLRVLKPAPQLQPQPQPSAN